MTILSISSLWGKKKSLYPFETMLSSNINPQKCRVRQTTQMYLCLDASQATTYWKTASSWRSFTVITGKTFIENQKKQVSKNVPKPLHKNFQTSQVRMCSIEILQGLFWTGSTWSWRSFYLQNVCVEQDERLSGVHVLAVRVIDLALLQRGEV